MRDGDRGAGSAWVSSPAGRASDGPPPEPPAATHPRSANHARHARQLLLPGVGRTGQQRLAAARVLVVGAGGLGSPALLYLAAAGVGTLGIVDDDLVDVSNLQRQVVHGTADAGRPKVDSAADAVTRIDPAIRVQRHREQLTADNADRLVAAYDLVVDGSDNFATRYVVGDACARAGVPHVWASVLRFDAHIAVWWAGHGPCYRCVFPRPPEPGQVPSCAEAGVFGALCGAVGSVQAGEALKLLIGVGEPLVGRLLVHDALRQSWDTLPVLADPACPTCALRPPRPIRTRTLGLDDPEAVATVTAAQLRRGLAAADPPVVVDVRTAPEWAGGTIPGAIRMPLAELAAGAADGSAWGPPQTPLVFYCASGIRSEQAAQLARAAGWTRVAHLAGGYAAWRADPGPTGAAGG